MFWRGLDDIEVNIDGFREDSPHVSHYVVDAHSGLVTESGVYRQYRGHAVDLSLNMLGDPLSCVDGHSTAHGHHHFFIFVRSYVLLQSAGLHIFDNVGVVMIL